MGMIERWRRGTSISEDSNAADSARFAFEADSGGELDQSRQPDKMSSAVSVDASAMTTAVADGRRSPAMNTIGASTVSGGGSLPEAPASANLVGDSTSAAAFLCSETADDVPPMSAAVASAAQTTQRPTTSTWTRSERRESSPSMTYAAEASGAQLSERALDSARAREQTHSDLDDQPLVIQADAPLVDGLRALLVHHLKRSVGSNIVNLSASQAELLEHHLARLASYAQKIVHTLAFATRFLSKHRFEGDNGEQESPETEGGGTTAPATMYTSSDPAMGVAGTAGLPPRGASVPERPPRKALKLNDDEILSLYRSAQMEASIEADWRGIQGPTPSRNGEDCPGSSRSATTSLGVPASATPPTGLAPGGAGSFSRDEGDQEYLRMLSRALQQPGRSPRAFTQEVLDGSKDAVCCQPRVGDAMLGVMGRAAVGQRRAPGIPVPEGSSRPG